MGGWTNHIRLPRQCGGWRCSTPQIEYKWRRTTNRRVLLRPMQLYFADKIVTMNYGGLPPTGPNASKDGNF